MRVEEIGGRMVLPPSRISIEGLGFQAGGIERVDIRDKGNYDLSVAGVSSDDMSTDQPV